MKPFRSRSLLRKVARSKRGTAQAEYLFLVGAGAVAVLGSASAVGDTVDRVLRTNQEQLTIIAPYVPSSGSRGARSGAPANDTPVASDDAFATDGDGTRVTRSFSSSTKTEEAFLPSGFEDCAKFQGVTFGAGDPATTTRVVASGSLLGVHDALQEAIDGSIIEAHRVRAIGAVDDAYLLSIHATNGRTAFANGDTVTVFDMDGYVLIDRAQIDMRAGDDIRQGDEYIHAVSGQFSIDLHGYDDVLRSYIYEKPSQAGSLSFGDNDTTLAFADIGCVLDPEPDTQQADEQARIEAEEQARREAEEQARIEAEEQAQREAEEQARIEAEEHARREAEEQARIEAEEQAQREAEEQARIEAEEQAQREAEEQARIEAEKQAAAEAENNSASSDDICADEREKADQNASQKAQYEECLANAGAEDKEKSGNNGHGNGSEAGDIPSDDPKFDSSNPGNKKK
jgi:Flp pilus assembly pilin Flp/DNA segregation ATPase FtsK/SpoIIIE-like protein